MRDFSSFDIMLLNDCRHISSFRDSLIQSEVSKNFIKVERIRTRDI